MLCEKCQSSNNLHVHHITYPSQTTYLCNRCHAVITSMNVFISRQLKTKLSDELRIKIWQLFLELPLGKKHNIVKTLQRQMNNRLHLLTDKKFSKKNTLAYKNAVNHSKNHFKRIKSF